MEVLKNEIEDEKLKLAQFQQELPPSTQWNNDAAKQENQWQQNLRNGIEKCDFSMPSAAIHDNIKGKVGLMERQSDEWCESYGYQTIMDIDVKKHKFANEEVEQKENLMSLQKKSLLDAQASKLKVQEVEKNIGAIKAELQEANARSYLLDQDLLDLNTLEQEMIKVCVSEAVNLQTIIEKVYVRSQDKFKLNYSQ